MLSERFEYDARPIYALNDLQRKIKNQIELKIRRGIYQFESPPCPVCKKNAFESLSNKDRYGLFVPIVICAKCGLIQTNPRMTHKSFTTFYQNEYRMLYEGQEVPSTAFFNKQETRSD